MMVNISNRTKVCQWKFNDDCPYHHVEYSQNYIISTECYTKFQNVI